jgi:hypothetical protein
MAKRNGVDRLRFGVGVFGFLTENTKSLRSVLRLLRTFRGVRRDRLVSRSVRLRWVKGRLEGFDINGS